MLNNKESFYKNNLNAKRGKQALISIFNVGFVYIFCVILFGLGFKLIGDQIPSVKNTKEEIKLKENEYYKERENAGLLIFDEKNNIIEPKDVVKDALVNETKTALIHYNLEEDYKHYQNYKDHFEIDSNSLKNNPILYYQISYKTDSSNYLNKPNKENNYLNFYDEVLIKKDGFTLYEENSNNVQRYLTRENTIALANYYFKQDSYESSTEIKKKSFDILYKTYEKELKDFNDFNLKGQEILKAHKSIHSSYSNTLIVEIFLSYLVGSFFVYVLPYLIRKDYTSLGDLILKTPICREDGKQINFLHNLGIFLINLIANMHTLFFVILTVFQNPGLALHNFGFLNIGILSVISAVFSLISLFIMLFIKKHQFIDALSLLLLRKKIDEEKVSEVNENGK